MNTRQTLLCLLGLGLLATGCAAPPQEGAPTPGLPGGAPVDAGPQDGQPGQDGAPPPPAQADPGSAPQITTFEALIEEQGGASVTISGTVTGASDGQLDFVVVDEDASPPVRPIHIGRFENGKFSIAAPATYDAPIWIMAMEMEQGEQPTPETPMGGLASPVKLGGTDIVVSLVIGENRFIPGVAVPEPIAPPEPEEAPAVAPEAAPEATE